jgi:transposase
VPLRIDRHEHVIDAIVENSSCTLSHAVNARNLVERFFNKIEHCRRVATRYDKLATNYVAFVELVSIGRWLRVNKSPT